MAARPLTTAANAVSNTRQVQVERPWCQKGSKYSKLEVDECLMGRYKARVQLGSGSFGETWQVEKVLATAAAASACEFYAAKLVENSRTTPTEAKVLEVIDASACEDVGVAQLFDLYTYKPTRMLVIIMEFIPNGSIDKLLAKNNWFRNEDVAMTVAYNVAVALDKLHNLNIIHRDIKPANIMQKREDKYVLIDFGLSCILQTDGTASEKGSRAFMAPEVFTADTDGDYGVKVDIWSLGATLYYMLTGNLIGNVERRQLKANVDKDFVLDRLQNCARGVQDAVMQMLTHDATKRPTAKDVLAHQVIRQAKRNLAIVRERLVLAQQQGQEREYIRALKPSSALFISCFKCECAAISDERMNDFTLTIPPRKQLQSMCFAPELRHSSWPSSCKDIIAVAGVTFRSFVGFVAVILAVWCSVFRARGHNSLSWSDVGDQLYRVRTFEQMQQSLADITMLPALELHQFMQSSSLQKAFVAAIRNFKTREDVLRDAIKLWCAASSNQTHRQAFRESGGVALLVNALSQYVHNIGIVRGIATIISRHAKDADGGLLFRNTNTIALLTSTLQMHSEDDPAAVELLTAFEALLSDPDIAATSTNATIAALCAMMDENTVRSEEVVMLASRALEKVARCVSTYDMFATYLPRALMQALPQLRKPNGVTEPAYTPERVSTVLSVVATLVAHKRDISFLQTQELTSLSLIVLHYYANSTVVMNVAYEPFLEFVFQLANTKPLYHLDGVQILVRILHLYTQDDTRVHQTLVAFSRIVTLPFGQTAARQAGAMHQITSILRSQITYPPTAILCLDALKALVEDHDNIVTMSAIGTAPLLLDVVKTHINNLRIVTMATQLLAQVLQDAYSGPAFINHGGLDVYGNAILRHVDVANLRNATSYMLLQLAQTRGIQLSIRTSTFFTSVVELMQRSFDDMEVLFRLCSSVASLSGSNNELWRKADIIPVLFQILRHGKIPVPVVNQTLRLLTRFAGSESGPNLMKQVSDAKYILENITTANGSGIERHHLAPLLNHLIGSP